MDVAFSDSATQKVGEHSFLRDYIEDNAVDRRKNIGDMIQYKYLLSVEGNDVATGLKWVSCNPSYI